jgi:hypothetical protein
MIEQSSQHTTSQRESRAERWPDFIVIGAARSGTTLLCTYLDCQPRVFVSDPKEPFFFSHESCYMKGDRSYLNLFAKAGPDQICGEASTSYSVWPTFGNVAGRIAAAVPQAKLIYVMRHPVDRCYSDYDYYIMRTGRTETFEEALDTFPPIISASMYMKQIGRYLTHFPRESLHFLLFEDLITNHNNTLAALWAFLDLPSLQVEESPSVNSSSEVFVRYQTTQRLRAIPGVSYLANRMPQTWRRSAFRLVKQSFLGRSIGARHNRPPMRPETRARLLQMFREPNNELEQFLDCDLSRWAE